MERYPLSESYVQKRLVPNRVCNRCGNHVLTSELEEYPYQCLHCDEDLYEFETTKTNIEPKSHEILHLVLLAHELIIGSEEEIKWL
jgi:hypothetical protein